MFCGFVGYLLSPSFRDDERREQEADDELREAPPDLRGVGLAARLIFFPHGDRDDREHEGPDADPNIPDCTAWNRNLFFSAFSA